MSLFGRFFNHCPALGGGADTVDHKDLYVDTLKFYENFFGHKAPSELWEPLDERFSAKFINAQNVNLLRLCNFLFYQMK